MAEHLVPIFRSEKDRVNCPFYFKIKACRHGNRCSHLQNRTTISPHSFSPICTTAGHDFPQRRSPGQPIDPKKIQEHFEHFYEDIFEELNKFGEIKTHNVSMDIKYADKQPIVPGGPSEIPK